MRLHFFLGIEKVFHVAEALIKIAITINDKLTKFLLQAVLLECLFLQMDKYAGRLGTVAP